MKQIIFTALAIAFTASVYAQDEIKAPEENAKLRKYGYYMMQEDYLIHALPNGKTDTVNANIILNNGKILTTIGEILEKKGTKIFLKVGECVSANGSIEDCDKLKQKLNKKEEKNAEKTKTDDSSANSKTIEK
ncbi:MAG: DUF6799 domain-containing protein [Bacteroidota bacterium]